jgi:hypothetical protein
VRPMNLIYVYVQEFGITCFLHLHTILKVNIVKCPQKLSLYQLNWTDLENSQPAFITCYWPSVSVSLTCCRKKPGTQPRFYELVHVRFVQMLCAINDTLQQKSYHLTGGCSMSHVKISNNKNIIWHKDGLCVILIKVCNNTCNLTQNFST